MSSALDMFAPRYADQLPPDAKRVLATLSDDVARLAYAAWNAADEELSKKPHQSPAKDPVREMVAYWERIHARGCELLRHAVPALNTLSNKDLDVLSTVGREAMIARKHGLDPTDTTALLRRTYAAGVDALVWAFLYHKFGKAAPTTPLVEMLSTDELELISADPAAPIGDVFPREELVQAYHDACQRATEILDSIGWKLETRVGRNLRDPKPAFENVAARLFEILCDLISTHRMPSNAPRRSWNWKDFSGREFKTPMVAEIGRFVSPPGNPDVAPLTSDNLKSGWNSWVVSSLTPIENRNFKIIHQMHGVWCLTANRKMNEPRG